MIFILHISSGKIKVNQFISVLPSNVEIYLSSYHQTPIRGYLYISQKHQPYITLLLENYRMKKQKKFKSEYGNKNKKHINKTILTDKGEILFMRATKKTNTDLPVTTNTNNTTETSTQTPIEIALQIDENGMTTLSALYSFLQLDQSHYKRWYNKNIINNDFATENIDYVIIRPNGENSKGGRPTLDFKLTSDFAKQLSMSVKNERGQEARKYFIACEQGLKVAAQKLQSSVDTYKLASAIENINTTLTYINTRLTKLEEQSEQQPQTENTYKKPYNPWFAKMQPKYKLLEEYFDITRGKLYHNILLELENLYDVNTQQIQADYCYENNISSCYPLEPYEFSPKYRDMIEEIVNSNLIKYGIASEDDPITSTKHITIFDLPAKEREK